MDADRIDWTALSSRGRAILRLVAVPAAQGFSNAEIAEGLGVRTSRIESLMKELRRELRAQSEEG
jgi:DNA-directed RNA polymerase specialized sigma24 family protein